MDVSNSDECSVLRSQCLNLKKKLEKRQQTLHDLHRQYKVADVQLLEYAGEIEYLQSEETAQRVKHEAKLCVLQQALTNINLIHNENISHLNTQLTEKSVAEKSLGTELQTLKSEEQLENEKHSEEPKFDQLSNEHDLLKENCDKLATEVEEFHKKQFAIVKALEQSKVKVTKLYEELNSQRKELAENANKIEGLREEIFEVNAVLSVHENKSLQENVKGNSLFAEVDGNRIYLQETLDKMKSNYLQLQEQHGKLEKIVCHLHKENSSLKSMWRKDLDEIEEDEESTVKTLIYRKKLLTEIIDRLSSEIEDQTIDEIHNKPLKAASGAAYKLYAPLIECKDSLIKKIENKLSDWYVTENLHSVALAKTKKTIYSLQLQINSLKERLDNNLAQNETECKLFTIRNKPLQTSELNKPRCIIGNINAGFAKSLPLSIKDNNNTNSPLVTDTADVESSADTSIEQKVLNFTEDKDLPLKTKKTVQFSADKTMSEGSSMRPRGRKIYVMKRKDVEEK